MKDVRSQGEFVHCRQGGGGGGKGFLHCGRSHSLFTKNENSVAFIAF